MESKAILWAWVRILTSFRGSDGGICSRDSLSTPNQSRNSVCKVLFERFRAAHLASVYVWHPNSVKPVTVTLGKLELHIGYT